MQALMGILGGTFDPPHLGHLHIARYAMSHLALDELRFIPCKQPVLKAGASATAEDRLAMLQLAVRDIPDAMNTAIDTRELDRDTPSYMVETLVSLKTDYPETSLGLILGMDAFLDFDHWFEWKKILTLAHLIVLDRPTKITELSPELKTLLQVAQTPQTKKLREHAAGLILFLDSPVLDISSTAIREGLRQGTDMSALLPPGVKDYIVEKGLYGVV